MKKSESDIRRASEQASWGYDSSLATRHSSLPLRVVRIIDRLNVGGPTKHVVWLTAGLDAAGFDARLVAGSVPRGEVDMGYFASACGVEPFRIPELSRAISPRDLVVAWKLLRLLFKVKPQIIHTHKAKAGAIGRMAALLYKWATPTALWLRPRDCRIVHTYHGHVFHSYFGPLGTRLIVAVERALARICTDRLIAISEGQRREILERFKIGRPDQFSVIPLGIDFQETCPHAGILRSELKIADDQPLVGAVGRLCEVKNYSMFLESAAKVCAAESGAHFVLIGNGHLRRELESRSQTLGISSRVTFTGFRRDALSLYPDMDVLALTSLNEGTPLSLIEGMYSGVAVAATEVGGVADLMGARRETLDGFSIWENGVTIPRGDAEAFARALQFLIRRPELRREMGRRGREFAVARLSRDRLIRDIQMLYADLTCPATVNVGGQSVPRSPSVRQAPSVRAVAMGQYRER
jgi:glycosyltransferase involved in cell wall biosynthesis